jgi:hypothetical protein
MLGQALGRSGRSAGDYGEGVMNDDATLAGYRASIDNIDAALVHLLAERFKITQAVGRYKAQAGLPPADPVAKGNRSNAFVRWPSRRVWIRGSLRSSCASSWPR